MSDITFYKLWHEELKYPSQETVPGSLKILNHLEVKEARIWEYLQEYRIHFSDLEIKTDYVGFASASFSDKF